MSELPSRFQRRLPLPSSQINDFGFSLLERGFSVEIGGAIPISHYERDDRFNFGGAVSVLELPPRCRRRLPLLSLQIDGILSSLFERG